MARDKVHVGVQCEPPAILVYKNPGVYEVPRWLVWVMSAILFVCVTAYITEILLVAYMPRFQVGSHMMEDLGVEGIKMFRQYDRDDDGVLSIEEFEPLAHIFIQNNETGSHVYELTMDEIDDVVTVEAFFQPLNLSTMTKSDSDPTFGGLDPLRGLKTWKELNKPWINLAARHFSGFLPDGKGTVGEVYEMSPTVSHSTLSSNRFFPPKLHLESDIVLHQLLSLFHPRPFLTMRFSPQGAVACVRAANQHFVEVVFRIHAEFQLNEPPFHPFWFTPAQFTGSLIISRDKDKVLFFHLYVPEDKALNVDMEWLNDVREGSNMEVDIGYMPQMELRATSWSVMAMEEGVDRRPMYMQRPEDYEEGLKELVWTEEISMQEARNKMEVHLYPFKQVPYYNFTETFSRAKEEGKLVHSILLWGALDDQSC